MLGTYDRKEVEIVRSEVGFSITPYRRKYLKGYSQRMSKDNTQTLWDDNVASVLIDQGFSIKESPRSIYRVEKLYQALNKYGPETRPRVNTDNKHVDAGIRFAYACFANPENNKLELLPFTPQLVHSITSNHAGSAGLTAWGQKKKDSEVRAYERGLQVIKSEKNPEPCIAFKRTQFDEKTRLVWGYPYSMTAIEGIFARPLIELFKSGWTPMAFGMQTGVLGGKLRAASYSHDWAYSIDVSSFDSSASRELIHIAFKILSTWFDLDQIEPTSGVSYRDIWQIVETYFITTPIVMPDLMLYTGKRHGVPSGSYFTQMVDSIVNVIYAGAIADRFNLMIGKRDIFVLGDDLLFWSDRDMSLESITDFATRLFDIQFNSKKSSKFKSGEVIHYLGRDWDDGVPGLPLDEILIRMTQPETYRKYSDDPVERYRQVLMLIQSYASVYENAYQIFYEVTKQWRKWYVPEISIENHIYMMGKRDLDPDFLSGLERYRRKYLEKDSVGLTPLASQFWK